MDMYPDITEEGHITQDVKNVMRQLDMDVHVVSENIAHLTNFMASTHDIAACDHSVLAMTFNLTLTIPPSMENVWGQLNIPHEVLSRVNCERVQRYNEQEQPINEIGWVTVNELCQDASTVMLKLHKPNDDCSSSGNNIHYISVKVSRTRHTCELNVMGLRDSAGVECVGAYVRGLLDAMFEDERGGMHFKFTRAKMDMLMSTFQLKAFVPAAIAGTCLKDVMFDYDAMRLAIEHVAVPAMFKYKVDGVMPHDDLDCVTVRFVAALTNDVMSVGLFTNGRVHITAQTECESIDSTCILHEFEEVFSMMMDFFAKNKQSIIVRPHQGRACEDVVNGVNSLMFDCFGAANCNLHSARGGVFRNMAMLMS